MDAGPVHPEERPGSKLVDPLVPGRGTVVGSTGDQEGCGAPGVQPGGHSGIAGELLDLGREGQAAFPCRPEQGLLAETVTGEKEAVPPLVVDPERPHAVEPRKRVRAPLEVCLEEHLAVTGGGERPTECGQLVADLEVVVDLAVVGHRTPSGNDHRLSARGGEVEDGESTEGERDRGGSGVVAVQLGDGPARRASGQPVARPVRPTVAGDPHGVREPGPGDLGGGREESIDAADRAGPPSRGGGSSAPPRVIVIVTRRRQPADSTPDDATQRPVLWPISSSLIDSRAAQQVSFRLGVDGAVTVTSPAGRTSQARRR